MKALTPKEQKIHQFITEFTDRQGYAPTYAEIQKQFEYKSVSSVQQFVDQLKNKGYLRSPEKKNLTRSFEALIPDMSLVRSIPLEGYVAAGRLTEAVNDRDYIEVPNSLLSQPGKDYFALTIKGDSMVDDGIHSGDIAIIRKQETASNGQTVVAMVDKEATIKKFFRRARHIELHPANREFEVIHVYPNENFSIIGILSSLIRKLE